MSRDSALLVEIPATALCTLVPITPGGLGGLGCRGVLGTLSLAGFGAFETLGLLDLLRAGTPTRDVGIGTGDGEEEYVSV